MKAGLKKLISGWEDLHFRLQAEANLLQQQGMALESFSRSRQADLLSDRIKEAKDLFNNKNGDRQESWVQLGNTAQQQE